MELIKQDKSNSTAENMNIGLSISITFPENLGSLDFRLTNLLHIIIYSIICSFFNRPSVISTNHIGQCSIYKQPVVLGSQTYGC